MHDHPVLACDLDALTREERDRRSVLAARVTGRFEEVLETEDGYAARLDPEFVHDAFEWVLLERRCCPFLRLELGFEPAAGPLWLRFGGGPGVKEFLAAAGLSASSADDGP